ncbi:alpha/beta-hydrolase [Auriculariales sp. MPI-PUGE-AT-0066]|nr:alpha/beta-hydrolase [Auriculariales sp. MPI-PUGE-AT-0066]
MSLCEHCVGTFKHDNTPTGTMKKIGSVDTYVALPNSHYNRNTAVVLLTDVYGHCSNNHLLADAFAASGFQVYVPDQFDGDPITEEARATPGFDMWTQWLPKHGPAETRPSLDAFLAGLRDMGISSFFVTGYCFGGRYTLDLAFDNVQGLKAIAISHPGLIKVPEDFEVLREKGKVPLLINSCEVDPQFPVDAQQTVDGLLGNDVYTPGYLRTYWAGCTHGFACRGDVSIPQIRLGKEGAFKATVDWFTKYL